MFWGGCFFKHKDFDFRDKQTHFTVVHRAWCSCLTWKPGKITSLRCKKKKHLKPITLWYSTGKKSNVSCRSHLCIMNVCVRVFIYLLKEFFISHWFLQKLQVRASTVLLRGAEVGCGPAFPLASGIEQINRQARLSCQWCASCGFYLHNEYKDEAVATRKQWRPALRMGLGEKYWETPKRGWLV